MGLNARERQANKRARDKGLPEPYAHLTVSKEEIKTRSDKHVENYLWAQAQDATGKYYRDECRSCIDLLAIYEGANILDKEAEDEDPEDKKDKKKKEKKENRPNPSVQKLIIQAVEHNGIKLEPNCQMEFRQLKEFDRVAEFREWLDYSSKARQDLFLLGRLMGLCFFN